MGECADGYVRCRSRRTLRTMSTSYPEAESQYTTVPFDTLKVDDWCECDMRVHTALSDS